VEDLVPKPPRDRTFRRRLGVYLTGVTIGLIILGIAQLARIQHAQRTQQGQAGGNASAGSVERAPEP